MYVEASLFFSFSSDSNHDAVPAPRLGTRLLRLLSLGQVRDPWVRERIPTAHLFEQLAIAFSSAGLTNLVSATVDGETVFRDDRGADLDLAPVLSDLRDRAAAAGDEYGARLELVAEHHDEVGAYIVQLLARRVHTADTPPVQLRIYAMLREFDVERSRAGYRDGRASKRDQLYASILERLIQTGGHGDVMAPLVAGVASLAQNLEEKVRTHLQTDATEAVLLPCIVRPRSLVDFEAYAHRGDDADAALFRPYPGFSKSTYYLTLWSSVLTELRATLKDTLIVDERGRPVLHIADEVVHLEGISALAPGGDLTRIGNVLDVAYFGGNDYEDELRADNCIPASDIEACNHAHWRTIRHRELKVRPQRGPAWSRTSLSDIVSISSGLGLEFES